MEALTGRINADGDLIFHDRELNLMDGAGFFKPVQAVPGFQPLHHGFFDDLLTVRHRHQLGVETITFDGESGILRQIGLPGQSLYIFKEGFKAPGFKTADLDENALPYAQGDIGFGNGGFIAGEIDAPVFIRYIVHTEPFQFVRDRRFETKQAGNTAFVLHEVLLNSYNFTYILHHSRYLFKKNIKGVYIMPGNRKKTLYFVKLAIEFYPV